MNTNSDRSAQRTFTEGQTLGDIYGHDADLAAALESTFGDGTTQEGKTLVVNGGFGLIKAKFANWENWLRE